MKTIHDITVSFGLSSRTQDRLAAPIVVLLLTIRYLCEPHRCRESTQQMWEDILRAFRKCDDIDFAYPTQRFYNNPVEGKPGTTPAAPEDTMTGHTAGLSE